MGSLINIILIIIIAAIVGLAVRYIYKEKKKGVHCIGCPVAGNCPHVGHCDTSVSDKQKK